MSSDFYVGQRLSYGDDLCTVRYVGHVEGTKGRWLGVEWDNPNRGKNSGEVQGVKYFQCLSQSSTAASFVRPNRPSETPRTFIEALRYKYVASTSITDDLESDVPTIISGKKVEEVGFDKIKQQQSRLDELRIVILDGLCIGTPSESTAQQSNVRDVCPRIIELDLSRNLFERWDELVAICEELPLLRNLKADGNRFRTADFTAEKREQFSRTLDGIASLGLENTLLTWEEAISISGMCPKLESLSLANNDYTTLPIGLPLRDMFPSLNTLNLEWNSFTTLTSLSALTDLPNLHTLILRNNSIAHITNPTLFPSERLPTFARTLTTLDLSRNAINTWSFIDALPTLFPGLTHLRTSHNPLYADLRTWAGKALTPDDGHMLTIARLRDVKMLNYSAVSEKDRLNAESWYLSLIAGELGAATDAEIERRVLQANPRWKELCDEYGEPTIAKKCPSTVDPNTLAARLAKCCFRLQAPAIGEEKHINEKLLQIPRSFSVYAVLGIVGDAFSLPPYSLRLTWETGEWDVRGNSGMGASSNEGAEWDSEDEDAAANEARELETGRVKREVEILAGTRAFGTWVEGEDVVIRIEVVDR